MNDNSNTTARYVRKKHQGMPTSDGAGVRMTRVIATPQLDHFDPFLLLDEFRSDDPDDYIAGFPDHPHRGFETVTYMLAGLMKHGDNQGNTGVLRPGSVQWMTAGRGIVHSEMPQQEDGLMWGFQLWVNLPAKDKMCPPRYQEIPPEGVPEVRLSEQVRARVIAGELDGISGPIEEVATEPFYYDLQLAAGGSVELPTPEGHNAFLYVYGGEIDTGRQFETNVGRGEIALLGYGTAIRARASGDARFLAIGGRPLGEPVARYGPFVMNTADEIRQAVMDYQAGRF